MPASDVPIRTHELLVYFGLLLAVALGVYGDYVVRGGFHSDDWSIAAATAHAPYRDVVSLLSAELGGRPLLSLLAPLPHVIFGVRPELHLANALVLGVLVSLCFYVLLRTIGVRRLHAGAIATIALLFPWSDAARFWPTAGVNNLAVCFFLVGSVLAIRGLAYRGWRSAAIHGLALALYLASALTYEVAAGAALLSGPLYLTRAPWSAVRIRWLVDAVVIGTAIAYSAVVTSDVRYVPPIPYKLKVAPQDTCEALSLVVSSFLPARADTPIAQVVGFAGIVAALVLVARHRLRARIESVRPWLIIGALALVWLVGGYAITLGSLHPLDPGANNRGNIFAALGFAMLVYAVVAGLAALLSTRASSPRLRWVVLGVSALIAVGYVDRIEHDEARWLNAQNRQQEVLTSFRRLGKPEPRTTIYAFGFPGHVATAVPVFAYSWDLDGAVRLLWDDRTLAAYPVLANRTLICEGRSVYPRGFGLGREYASSYPSALIVDVATGASYRPRNRSECRSALTRVDAAPWELTHTRTGCPILSLDSPFEKRVL